MASIIKKARHILTKSKYPVELSYTEVAELIQQPCHYCGTYSAVEVGQEGKYPVGLNGLDRVDSGQNYITGNVARNVTI